MGISDFMGGDNVSRSTVFQKHRKDCRSKAEERSLEMSLLKPEKIPQYAGPPPRDTAVNPLLARTAKVVFRTEEELRLFRKFFPVSQHVEQSISNPILLVLLLRALEKGEIRYDRKTESLSFHGAE